MAPKTNPDPPPAIELEIACASWTRAEPAIERLLGEAGALALQGAHGTVSVLLAGDALVRELNVRHRGKDRATNVLSFPAPKAFPGRLGDVVLAFETIAAEAETQGKPFADHARHLIVHGILHLLGHDHADAGEAERMEARERAILARLGVRDPYAEPLKET